MINIIQNMNTLLEVATVTTEDEEFVGELWFDLIIGWQVETKPDHITKEPQSSATPITANGEPFDGDSCYAIVNKFTEEWDIPYDRNGEGFEVLLKYLLRHREGEKKQREKIEKSKSQ